VHQPRYEPLEELALPEHDRHLVARAQPRIAPALDGLRSVHEPNQLPDPASAQRAADPDRGRKRDCGGDRGYTPLAFLISAEIAGTTSCRSPITP